ncbi:MAG: diguanylate cyclase [Caldimonas sp.]
MNAEVRPPAMARPGATTHASKDNILLVDDDPGVIQMMGRMLRDVGNLRFATSGADALRQLCKAAPDLILLDAEMPGMSGFQLFDVLKADPALAEVPVIFVTSHTEPAFEAAGFDLGAADFIGKPVRASLLVARVKTQLRFKRMADQLRGFATVDSLTSLANRRCFDAALTREWKRARRSGESLSLLMIDVDHFKLFNDRYGHPAGDQCLRAVARAMAGATMRPADLVARVGGEEFAMLLPITPREGAEHMAHRVLDAVESLGVCHASSPTAGHVTVSVGISCYDDASACWIEPSADSRFASDMLVLCSEADMMKAADKAVYAAKHHGRAQAWLLDVADVETPALARVTAPVRARQRREARPEPAAVEP